MGAVGHRELENEGELGRRVREALEQARQLIPPSRATPVVFSVVSALAEGADRLVAREALSVYADNEVDLVAVLPLPIDAYKADFRGESSGREFDELRERATVTIQGGLHGGSRTEAYLRAGQQVVMRSDVIVALWDGQPARGQGGTEEVITYARRRGVPVLLVPVRDGTDQPSIADQMAQAAASPHMARAADALRHFDKYNRRVSAKRLARTVERERARLRRAVGDSRLRADVERVAAWVLPHFVRAEVLATSYQRRYYLMSDALFGLSALAVAAVAIQTSFAPGRPLVALAEAVFLTLVLAAVAYARRGRLHEGWIGCRSLAEAFRSGQFVAVTGAPREEGPDASTAVGELWFRRAFSDTWRRRPPVEPSDEAVPDIKRFISTAWIQEQITYHKGTVAARNFRRHRIVTMVITALFMGALAVALLHGFETAHEGTWWSDFLTFMAIALPGFGAALTGHREQRQYRLHSERSSRTAARLTLVRDELDQVSDLASIQQLSGEAQAVVLAENLDWYGDVELQDLEMVV